MFKVLRMFIHTEIDGLYVSLNKVAYTTLGIGTKVLLNGVNRVKGSFFNVYLSEDLTNVFFLKSVLLIEGEFNWNQMISAKI